MLRAKEDLAENGMGWTEDFPSAGRTRPSAASISSAPTLFTTWMAPKRSTHRWTGDRATWMLDLERELARGWGCGPPE
jgi:hypothetical protein